MQAKEINLLQEKPKEAYTTDTKNLKLDIFLIIGFFALIVAVYFYGIVLDREQESVTEKVVAKENVINTMRDKEYLYRTAKLKISAAEEIVAKRQDLVPILDFVEKTTQLVEETIPEGIDLETLEVPNLTTINVTGVAKDSSVLDTFVSLLTVEDMRFNFKKVKILNLSRSKDEKYNFSLSLVLAEPIR